MSTVFPTKVSEKSSGDRKLYFISEQHIQINYHRIETLLTNSFHWLLSASSVWCPHNVIGDVARVERVREREREKSSHKPINDMLYVLYSHTEIRYQVFCIFLLTCLIWVFPHSSINYRYFVHKNVHTTPLCTKLSGGN